MSTNTNDSTVEELRALVAELSQRVSALESELAAFPHRHAGDPTPDEMLAISAAVAAFLGKRATVRQVHVRRRAANWAAQGRSGIQDSHRIEHHAPRHHGEHR